MDFGLRESLLIIGPLFIVAILLHGYWRMRNSNELKMSLDKSFMSNLGEDADEEDDLSMLRAELPNGGARVRKIPEQTALDLDENADVPVLMEPVDVDALEVQESEQEIEVEDRPEMFIVVYVTALDEPFDGQALLETLVDEGMQFGEMSIFHKLSGSGESIFSLVNAVEPGTFDPKTMDELATPAVSLFMRVHELKDPVRVYDAMIDTAHKIADELGGEVKDETRSVMTPQTIEHGRETIREYLRGLKSA